MTEKTFNAKGWMHFVHTKDEVEVYVHDLELWEREIRCGDCPIYDLMKGEDFLKCVKSGGITDYDGSIAHVFVEGYVSNLGLHHLNFSQGGFLVDAETWEELCDELTVLVNWANK